MTDLQSPGLQPSVPGVVVLADSPEGAPSRWLCFARPQSVLVARRIGEVRPLLDEVEMATAMGLWAAGFLAYEAAPAFEPEFTTRPAGALPLAWFGIYSEPASVLHSALPAELGGGAGAGEAVAQPPWPASFAEKVGRRRFRTTLAYPKYRQSIGVIREAIARGDLYQANLTWRLAAPFAADPWEFFLELLRAQRCRYGAYLDLGEHVLCSASPELLLRRDGERLVSRPMKGTAPRGRWSEEDEALGAQLQASAKNRAENLMIVDMVRNDLARVARPGTVAVPGIFELERYPSLWQLTSTVTAESVAPLPEILAALFPAASITGAPKIAAMRLLAGLEDSPRGIYTGAIGYSAPGRRAQFNVAIRTLVVDRMHRRAEYGTGGGIVWDSRAKEEWREGKTKALVLAESAVPPFELLETLGYDSRRGFALLDRHLARLVASARYFGFPCDRAPIERALAAHAASLAPGRQRVRLLLAESGAFRIESAPLVARPRRLRVAVATQPVDPADRFLYHKTTRRALYEAAQAAFPEHDEVLLWNPNREVTEATRSNLVVRLAGELVTPPLDCGLLPGSLRAELLARRRIRERRLSLADLATAEALYLINSVRGWMPVTLDLPTGSRMSL